MKYSIAFGADAGNLQCTSSELERPPVRMLSREGRSNPIAIACQQ